MLLQRYNLGISPLCRKFPFIQRCLKEEQHCLVGERTPTTVPPLVLSCPLWWIRLFSSAAGSCQILNSRKDLDTLLLARYLHHPRGNIPSVPLSVSAQHRAIP